MPRVHAEPETCKGCRVENADTCRVPVGAADRSAALGTGTA